MRAAAVGGLGMEAGVVEHEGWWAAVGGAVTALIGALGVWLAQRVLGKAAFQQAINDGFQKLATELRKDNEALRAELAEKELAHARQAAELRGQIINLTQANESLKSALRRAGIPIPEATAPSPSVDDIIELPASAVSYPGEQD